MKTWTNGGGLLMLCLSLVLSGCEVSRIFPVLGKPATSTTVRVAGADIQIGGVQEYCVNQRQSRTTKEGAFVVLGPCDSERPAQKNLLVAVVSPVSVFGEQADITTLDTFFQSSKGRRILSNTGNPETVDTLETVKQNNVFYIFTRDSSDPVLPETTKDKWRGFFVVSDRMVSISLVNFTDTAVSAKRALRQLQAFAAGIKKLNESAG